MPLINQERSSDTHFSWYIFSFSEYYPSGDSNRDYFLFKLLELAKERGGFYNPFLTGGQLPNGGFDNLMETGGSFLGSCEFLKKIQCLKYSPYINVILAMQFTRSMPAFPAEGYNFVKGPGFSNCLPLHYVFPKHASWTDEFNSMLLALREAGFDQTLYRRSFSKNHKSVNKLYFLSLYF